MPTVIDLGGLLIATDKLAFVLFALLSIWAVGRLGRSFGASDAFLGRTAERAILAGIVGARIAFVAENPSVYRQAPFSALYFWQPGYVVWAGLAAGAVYVGLAIADRGAWRSNLAILASGILLPLALYLIAIATSGQFLGPNRLRVGQPAPPLALVDLNGDPVSLKALRGHPVILNIWATWCYACREEMPLLSRTYQAYRDSGLELVGVDLAESEPRVRVFLDQIPVSYPIWLDPPSSAGQAAPSPTNAFFAKAGGVGLPTTIFIGKRGIIRSIAIGELTRPALAIELRKLGVSRHPRNADAPPQQPDPAASRA